MTRPRSLAQIGSGQDPTLHSINMCVYSHPGEGKTAFWSSGNERVLILDSDPGMGTQTAIPLGFKPYVMPVTDYEELQQAYEFCKHDLKTDLPGVTWVVWDSLTLFQDRTLIDDIMPDAIAENPRQEEFVPSRREYLINMNRIGRYVRLFVDLDINFGLSCHVEQDTEGGDTLLMPQVQGKNMPSKIAGYMNVVGYLGKAEVEDAGQKKTVQRLLTRRVGKFYAKDRFNALVPHVDKPTLPKVEALINEKRNGSPAPSASPARRPTKAAAKKAAAQTK